MVFKILTNVMQYNTPYSSYDQNTKRLVTFCEQCIPDPNSEVVNSSEEEYFHLKLLKAASFTIIKCMKSKA